LFCTFRKSNCVHFVRCPRRKETRAEGLVATFKTFFEICFETLKDKESDRRG